MGQLPAEGSGSIALTPASQPRLGGNVSFDCLGLAGLRNPRVWVAAMQDDAVVYGAGGSPTEIFKLGGDSSLWQHAAGPPSARRSCTTSSTRGAPASGMGAGLRAAPCRWPN